MNSFFLYLPSNVKDVYNRNSIGNYITRLPQNLRLDERWEVGLAEITYSKSWYNLETNQIIKLLDDAGNSYSDLDSYIEKGSYDSPQTLIQIINDKIQNLCALFTSRTTSDCDAPRVEYSRYSKRITIFAGKLGNRLLYVSMDTQLAEILGLQQVSYLAEEEEEYEVLSETIKGNIPVRAMDINAGVHSLFVYCDIVKPTIVGDSYSQILRTVQVPKVEFGETVQKIYDRIHYYPLNSKEFQTIEIDIKDDTGKTIRFEEGRVIVVLHFKHESI